MGPLRFDGLYLRESRPEIFAWLRFYEAGTVLTVTTTPGPPAQVASWLRLGHPHASAGQWSFDAGRVCFVASNAYGAVAFEGEARGDALSLAASCRVNDYRDEGAWIFRALDAQALDGPPRPAGYRAVRDYEALARAGVTADVVAALRVARDLTRARINYATPEELAAWASIDLGAARRVCAWRDGR